MKGRTMISLCRAFVLALAATSFGACSSSHMQAGTDGVTHWLRDCDTSAECGDLQCLCGVCTRSCSEDDACSDLGGDAVCTEASSCASEAMTCQLAEPDPMDGNAGAGGRDAATATDRDGGAASLDDAGDVIVVGTPRDAGMPGPEPEDCEAMDARSTGAFCYLPLGFSWNGTFCEEVNCQCEGAACDALYEIETECERTYAACHEPVDFPPDVEIVALWHDYDSNGGYEPEYMAISGALHAFVLEPPTEPSDEGRYPIEDPELGVQTDPNAPRVAMAGIFVIAAGKLETDRDGVIALDPDKVIGQARGASLFWTPVDLPDTRGVRGFDPNNPIGPLSAGYHLFVYGVEVPLTTELSMGTRIRT